VRVLIPVIKGAGVASVSVTRALISDPSPRGTLLKGSTRVLLHHWEAIPLLGVLSIVHFMEI
jgi:hypothetical protein